MKASFVTLGCSKNRVDSEVMVGKLLAAGVQIVPPEIDSDIRVINTCTFIESAKKESIDTIMEAIRDKNNGRLRKLVLTGCMVQRYRDELEKELPEVDVFLGTSDFQHILDTIREENATKSMVSAPEYIYDENTPRHNTLSPYSAFLKIGEGCSKRCSFCIIPQIRGNLRSRSIESIVAEAKNLVAQGIKEIILISQETTFYGRDLRKLGQTDVDLPKLLRELVKVDGLKWLRMFYLHPDDFSDELLKVVVGEEKICKYVDVPVQHISDEILGLMRRRKKSAQLRKLFEKIRAHDEMFVRTSVITGHPGETAAHFAELSAFVREMEFHYLAIFPYSDEEDTHSYTLKGKNTKKVIQARYNEIWDIQQAVYRKKFKQLKGTIQEALIEKVSDETDLLLQGRIMGQGPEIDGVLYINEGNPKIGEIQKVRISDANGFDLVGEAL